MLFFNYLQLALIAAACVYLPVRIWKMLRSHPLKAQFDPNIYAMLAGFSICELVLHPASRVTFGALSLMMVLCLWLVASPWVRQREQETLNPNQDPRQLSRESPVSAASCPARLVHRG